jgi:Domain of unknown function (DUF4123)
VTKELIARQLIAALYVREAGVPARAYALVDGALHRSAYSLMKRQVPLLPVIPTGGIVARSDLSALSFLLDLSALQESQQTRGVTELARWALEYSAVTWLTSHLAPEPLAAELAHRLDAELNGGMSVLLRFGDARVLPVLHEVLEPTQRAEFFGCASGWWYIDRHGELQALPLLQPEPAAPEFRPPLRLTALQEQQLLDAAEPDAVLQLLRQHDAQTLDTVASTERYDFAKSCIGRAKRWSLSTPTDFMLFCMVALDQGPTFDEEDRWAGALADVRAGKLTWAKAIQEVVQ